ncbi:MAG: response regulator [Deltaproteobacteria bacterium]|nr:response regulator [Deltaproteobacteria bacterium]
MEKKMNILVLDDEPIVGERLKPALEKDGHHVDIFTDSRQALACLETGLYDIVVTDLRMDEVDGLQVLETVIRKSKSTKVIMITGYATLEVARESLTKGAFDFIAKPFKLGEIRETIGKAVAVLQADDRKEQAMSK